MIWILHTARISNGRTVSFLPSSKLTITNSYSIYNHQLMFVWIMDTCNYFTWSLQNLTSHSLRPSKYNLTRDGWENGSLCLSRNSHLTAVQRYSDQIWALKKMCMANYGKSDQTSQTNDLTVLCWPKSIIFVMLSSLSSLWLKHTYGKLHKCKCFSWFRLYFESFK